jgi:ribosomal protein L37AE/L43A
VETVTGPETVTIHFDTAHRVVVRCRECRSTFTPGLGKTVPDACLGCRTRYVMTTRTRSLINEATDTATCPRCDRLIQRALVRGRRRGDWECSHCCLAWLDSPAMAS